MSEKGYSIEVPFFTAEEKVQMPQGSLLDRK